MTKQQSFHMPTDEFRKQGKLLIDWIADYYENIEQYPVLSKVKPNEIKNALPEKPPEKGESFAAMMKDVNDLILPGITHWQSPNFFAYFPSNVSPPSILGELLSAGLGVQGMLWATSPACTELETKVLDWVVHLLNLPSFFHSDSNGGGVIQDTASSSSLCALIAAREDISNHQINQRGCRQELTAYCSDQTHSSIEKAVKIAGIGADNLRYIATNENFAMLPEQLEAAIKKDLQQNKQPFFVVATIGTTSSNAMDPLDEIGKICQQHNIWLHVDAAMSGSAAVCPEFRFIHHGLEYANSYTFNPHKWLFTNFDCNCFFVKDKNKLISALSILPEYLRNKASEEETVIDYRDWQIPLGRRFRALKLWFVLRHYGVEGLQYHIREHVRLARLFAQWIDDSSDFESVAPAPLNLICFKHKNGDQFNQKLLEQLNASGKIYLTHTKLNDEFVLRMSIGQKNTTEEHVKKAWELIQETAKRL